MSDISTQLKTLLSLVPSYSFQFFLFFFVENYKSLIELVLVCPDKLVRSWTINILLHNINILVSYHDLSLNQSDDKFINKKVLGFLNVFQLLMGNDVAKNWNKLYSYFEV